MGVNSLPKTVSRQRRGCDLNPGPSATEFSTLTTRLPSHPNTDGYIIYYAYTSVQSVITSDRLGRCIRFVYIYACILLCFCIATVSR